MIRLSHKHVVDLHKSGLFTVLVGYGDLFDTIAKYAGEGELRDERLGAAFEVFAEFFLKKFSGDTDPLLGWKDVQHTSDNKFEVGIDFIAKNLAGAPVYIQVKNRAHYEFTRADLGSFVSRADEDEVPKSNRILFTSALSDAPFHTSYPGGAKQMRVVSRRVQEELIDRTPGFWDELCESIEKSAERPDREPPPELWPHQQEMVAAGERVLSGELLRGKVICATGGGKTRAEYELFRRGFERGWDVQVLVAPTIELLKQHHDSFSKWGAFDDGLVGIHFRTGSEPNTDEVKFQEYMQTTSEEDLVKFLVSNRGKRFLVFVTYASEEKLFQILGENAELGEAQVRTDLVVYDEFHHTVRQDDAYRDHLLTIPSDRVLFFSASEKRGRMLSSFDEEVYGPTLASVPYSRLRDQGYLVPKITIKPVRLDGRRMKAIGDDLKKDADRDGFNLRDALFEAGAIVIARQDLMRGGYSNIITFSRQVAICKAIVGSAAVRAELGKDTLLQAVYAGVDGRTRRTMFADMKGSTDSIMCQHSVMKEGIDNPAANGGVFSRNMDVIGTQQALGRLVRINPEDRKDFLDGKISIDDPKGWRKYEATVYLIVHDERSDDFRGFLEDLSEKLQFAGLGIDDWQFMDLVEDRHGKEPDDLGWLAPLPKAPDGFKDLHEFIKHIVLEQEEAWRKERTINELRKLGTRELREMYRSKPTPEVRQVLQEMYCK